MSKPNAPIVYKGKSLGVLVLVAAQLLIGFIHVIAGVWILSMPRIVPSVGHTNGVDIYNIYTVIFGLLTLVFAAGLWLTKRWGWIGTVAVAIFVTVADMLTLLDLPSIPGIPKTAGFLEISYSLLILVYLLQPRILTMFKIRSA